MSKNKSGAGSSNKGGTNVRPIGGAAAVAAAATAPGAASTPATTTATTADTKPVKVGPVKGDVGSTVEYVLPSGSKISAVVIEHGHCACPTCDRRLRDPELPSAEKLAKMEEQEAKRLASLQEEWTRTAGIIQAARARAGKPALSAEELMKAVFAPKAPEAETKAS